MSLSIYHTHHSLTQVWHISEEGNTLGLDKKKVTTIERSLTALGSNFGADSISKEVVGFSPFMVSPRINTVFIVSCV